MYLSQLSVALTLGEHFALARTQLVHARTALLSIAGDCIIGESTEEKVQRQRRSES